MTRTWILAQNSSKHALWGKEVLFGGTHDGRQHFGVQIPPKRSKIASYRHVRAATNDFETNDVIEDWRHWLRSVARSPSLVGRRILFIASWKLLRLYTVFSNIYNATIVSADALYSVGLQKLSFCKIYTVFVGNLFYRLSHKKISYAVCWKASKTSKTLIRKRRTLGEPFDFAQT